MMPYASERPPDAQPCTGVQGVSDSQGCQPLGCGTARAMGRGARQMCDRAQNTPAAKRHKRTTGATIINLVFDDVSEHAVCH